MLNKYIFTGGPGGGKTGTLEVLNTQGYDYLPESAREIIKQRLAKGLAPRPEPQGFAFECLQSDIKKYENNNSGKLPVFFDRSVLDSLYMLNDTGVEFDHNLDDCFKKYKYSNIVFFFPPWEEIYAMDNERDQTYFEAEKVYSGLLEWYQIHGYMAVTVPKISISQRVDFIINTIKNAV